MLVARESRPVLVCYPTREECLNPISELLLLCLRRLVVSADHTGLGCLLIATGLRSPFSQP